MPKVKTLTICIPAYNEENNIGKLLADVLVQKTPGFTIKKIIVTSDGSTDKTIEEAKKVKNKKIQLINRTKRKGLAKSLNDMFMGVTTDVLVTLDADIRMDDPLTLAKLIAPILSGADYTSAAIKERSVDTFFAHSIVLSMQIKREIYRAIRGGNNIYTSFGLARAYSKRFYTAIKFKSSVGNDMYTYLHCQKKGFTFEHVPEAIVTYEIPKHLRDYSRQSARYFQARNKMLSYFDQERVRQEFSIPVSAVAKSMKETISLVAKHPVHAIAYMGYLAFSYVRSLVTRESDRWSISETTKYTDVEQSYCVHVLTKYFYPIAAGIETNILETYSALTDHWDIHIHTARDSYTKKNAFPAQEIVKNLSVHRYPFRSEWQGYAAHIDFTRTDVVALHNFNLYYAGIFFRILGDKILGRKNYLLVVTPHGGYNPEWSLFPLFSRFIKWTYHHTLGLFFLNYVTDKVRAVSQWEKREMVKSGVNAKKITVIANGLEDEAFIRSEKTINPEIKKMIKKLGTYIIQVGRIYPIKNYETVIRALPLIDKNISYVIVGQEEKSAIYKNYKSDLVNLARELGVEKRVVFAGVVRGKEKYFLMRHAVAMVHLALWESFCNVVHEAMSQGTICVVSNSTALPYLVKEGKTGYVIETRDSRALASRINEVARTQKSKKSKDMKAAIEKIGRANSWREVAAKMRKMYES